MKARLPLMLLLWVIGILFSLQAVSGQGQGCLNVNLPKAEFLIGEAFQAEITIANPLEEISMGNIDFVIKDGALEKKVEVPLKILKVSDGFYYAYFSIPNVKEGDYKLKVRTLCKEYGRIVGAEEARAFSVQKEKVGEAHKRLSGNVAGNWGNTEENALAILALREFDKELSDNGVENLLSNSKNGNGECWPAGSCKVKDTALALIALQGADDISAFKAKNWLLDAQNSLLIGEWTLVLTSSQDGSCQVSLNGQNETLMLEKGLATMSLSFADAVNYNLTINCDVALNEAKVSHSYLGKVIDFALQERNGIYEITASNEKCWGAVYRGSCDFESTAFAYFALTKTEEGQEETLDWLRQNRNDILTLHQVFLNLFTEESYFLDWIIANQALGGYWKDTSIGSGGNADAFLTALAIFALADNEDDLAISATSRGKEWLLNRMPTLNKRYLAASLFFAFSVDEIKDILSISPGAIKVMQGNSFEVLLENKGIRDINLTLKYLSEVEEVEIAKGSYRRFFFDATSETNYFITISYSGLYNIPVFIVKIIEGEEFIENITLLENLTLENVTITAFPALPAAILPSISFSGDGNETLFDNQTEIIRLRLRNSNPQQLNDIFLLLTSSLYGIIRVEPAKVNLPPNSETEIILFVNENKNVFAGVYEGEVKARDSVSAAFPIKIEILASGEMEEEQNCFDYFFQCCEEVEEGALAKPDLDDTCPGDLICADICKEKGEEVIEKEKQKISPLAWIILGLVVGSIILIILLRAKMKGNRKKSGMEETVGRIEDKWKGGMRVGKSKGASRY